MRFANPQLLYFLGLVPLLIVGMALRYGWRKRMVERLGDQPQIKKLVSSISHGKRLLKSSLFIVGVIFLILTIARPQAGGKSVMAPYLGLDIVVALDFSKSMYARDAHPSRIDRAKAELNQLLDQLKGDRVGLVAFAGETISYPLTTDYTAAKLFWRDMNPNDMPVGGTAIGKAIVAATRLLVGVRGKGKPRDQVIILLTDGEDHQSDPIAAAKEAAKLGIRIFSVGIGSRSGEPIPEVAEDGTISRYMTDEKGKPITTRLDTKTLKTISTQTKGEYIAMNPRSFGVEPILNQLEKLKKSEIQSRAIRQYDEAYTPFLFIAFLCFLFELAISDRKREVSL